MELPTPFYDPTPLVAGHQSEKNRIDRTTRAQYTVVSSATGIDDDDASPRRAVVSQALSKHQQELAAQREELARPRLKFEALLQRVSQREPVKGFEKWLPDKYRGTAGVTAVPYGIPFIQPRMETPQWALLPKQEQVTKAEIRRRLFGNTHSEHTQKKEQQEKEEEQKKAVNQYSDVEPAPLDWESEKRRDHERTLRETNELIERVKRQFAEKEQNLARVRDYRIEQSEEFAKLTEREILEHEAARRSHNPHHGSSKAHPLLVDPSPARGLQSNLGTIQNFFSGVSHAQQHRSENEGEKSKHDKNGDDEAEDEAQVERLLETNPVETESMRLVRMSTSPFRVSTDERLTKSAAILREYLHSNKNEATDDDSVVVDHELEDREARFLAGRLDDLLSLLRKVDDADVLDETERIVLIEFASEGLTSLVQEFRRNIAEAAGKKRRQPHQQEQNSADERMRLLTVALDAQARLSRMRDISVDVAVDVVNSTQPQRDEDDDVAAAASPEFQQVRRVHLPSTVKPRPLSPSPRARLDAVSETATRSVVNEQPHQQQHKQAPEPERAKLTDEEAYEHYLAERQAVVAAAEVVRVQQQEQQQQLPRPEIPPLQLHKSDVDEGKPEQQQQQQQQERQQQEQEQTVNAPEATSQSARERELLRHFEEAVEQDLVQNGTITASVSSSAFDENPDTDAKLQRLLAAVISDTPLRAELRHRHLHSSVRQRLQEVEASRQEQMQFPDVIETSDLFADFAVERQRQAEESEEYQRTLPWPKHAAVGAPVVSRPLLRAIRHEQQQRQNSDDEQNSVQQNQHEQMSHLARSKFRFWLMCKKQHEQEEAAHQHEQNEEADPNIEQSRNNNDLVLRQPQSIFGKKRALPPDAVRFRFQQKQQQQHSPPSSRSPSPQQEHGQQEDHVTKHKSSSQRPESASDSTVAAREKEVSIRNTRGTQRARMRDRLLEEALQRIRHERTLVKSTMTRFD